MHRSATGHHSVFDASPISFLPSRPGNERIAGIEPSVGSVGDIYDNTLAETINGLYKAEVIHRRGPWRNFEAVEFARLEWVDWFSHRRLLGSIGISRQPRLKNAMLDASAMAA